MGISDALYVKEHAVRVRGHEAGIRRQVDRLGAAREGLLPPELVPRVRILGNAALRGAALLLLDRERIPAAEALARSAETVDLTTNPGFMTAYTDCMFFDG